jgi:hypothetical protein
VRLLPLKLLAPILLSLAPALWCGESRARGHLGVEIGAEVGYGTSPGGTAVNPLGIGFGARAGITFYGLYVGVDAVDYLGSGDGNGGQYHALQFGGELGYGFKVRSLTIRPKIGAGEIYLLGSAAGLTSPAIPTDLSPYLEPGAVALISAGVVYIGIDAGALVIVSQPEYTQSGSQYTLTTESFNTGFTMHGQIGLKF